MTEGELLQSIAYCGLPCGVCRHARGRCQGCRSGGGEDRCHQRECCLEKKLDGCWQCGEFPCDTGFFADAAWRGITIGCAQALKDLDMEEFIRRVTARLGETVDWGDYRSRASTEIVAMLCGDRNT